MGVEFERPEIDFLILADRAEGINGKLYLMGGGWQALNVTSFEQPVAFSLAVGVLVPWNATNENHSLQIFVEHEDGTAIEPPIEATLNVGRPAGAVPGQSFRALLAVNGMWKLPGPGMYRAVATLSTGELKRSAFRAQPTRTQPGLEAR